SEASGIKSDLQGYGQSAKGAQGAVKGARQKAGNIKVPTLPPQKKKTMSLFGKKNACESCGQKLHPSWDECPYCGWKKGQPAVAAAGGAAPAAAGGGAASAAPARTMALDLGGGGGGGGLGMLGWFIPLEGSRVGELIELRGRVTIGKSGDNNVVI